VWTYVRQRNSTHAEWTTRPSCWGLLSQCHHWKFLLVNLCYFAKTIFVENFKKIYFLVQNVSFQKNLTTCAKSKSWKKWLTAMSQEAYLSKHLILNSWLFQQNAIILIFLLYAELANLNHLLLSLNLCHA
jgi:hypothetical protein